jgi:hypothetical protein
LRIADLIRFDRTEEGKELIERHLRDPYVVEAMRAKYGGMVGYLDQPGQDRRGVDLKHAGDRTDPLALGERSYGPDQPLG